MCNHTILYFVARIFAKNITPYFNTIVLFISIILTLIVFIFIFRKIQNKKLLKTERDLILKLLKSGTPAQAIFHDLYLKKYNGEFSQIDLVVVTDIGIIVFEVKDFSGWIFGSGHYYQWTKVLAYGKKKYYFYNPIMQNNNHIQNLKRQLKQSQNIPFYSVIVFYGDCILKEVNFVPNGTYLVKSERVIEFIKIIIKNQDPIVYTDKIEIVKVLKTAAQNGENLKIQKEHIENINNILGKKRIFD